jgi:hypothetical protein
MDARHLFDDGDPSSFICRVAFMKSQALGKTNPSKLLLCSLNRGYVRLRPFAPFAFRSGMVLLLARTLQRSPFSSWSSQLPDAQGPRTSQHLALASCRWDEESEKLGGRERECDCDCDCDYEYNVWVGQGHCTEDTQ